MCGIAEETLEHKIRQCVKLKKSKIKKRHNNKKKKQKVIDKKNNKIKSKKN